MITTIQDLPGSPIVNRRHIINRIDTEKLIDLYVYDTFINRRGKGKKMRGQIRKDLGDDRFQVYI